MTTQERPEFVLFYMENCNFCKKILTQLKQKPELLKNLIMLI